MADHAKTIKPIDYWQHHVNQYYECGQSKMQYCRQNLHHLWDTGVGYLKGRLNFPRKVRRLEVEFPKSALKTQQTDMNPSNWVRAEYRYAAFIYSTPQGQRPDAAYYRRGQAIARKQMILAGYQLAYLLNTLLNPHT